GPAHAPYRLAGAGAGMRGTLDVGLGHLPVRSAALELLQVNAHVSGQLPGLGRGLDCPGVAAGGRSADDEVIGGQVTVAAVLTQAADHGTAVLSGALELHQRSANVQ